MNFAEFSINADSGLRGFDATNNQGLTLALRNPPTAQVQRWRVDVYAVGVSDAPKASKNAPVLTLVGATSGQSVYATTPASSITTTAAASGVHSWLVRSLVNDGLDQYGKANPDYVYERVISIRSAASLRKIVGTESTQYSDNGWADAQNEEVDAFGAVSPGYNRIQEEGSDLNQRLKLNFIGSYCTAADDAGNARTNVTFRSILNADVDAAAAIAGTKISPDFGNQNVYTTGIIYSGTTTGLSEQAGSVVAVSSGSGGMRGGLSWQHSDNVNPARLVMLKSRGTRASPTAVIYNADASLTDVLGTLVWYGYSGATGSYAQRAFIQAYVDGAITDAATPTLPTAIRVMTASTAAPAVPTHVRTIWASTGTQTHNTDASGAYYWQIGGVPMMSLGDSGTTSLALTGDLLMAASNIKLGSDPADAGRVRLSAGDKISWEGSTERSLWVSSDVLLCDAPTLNFDGANTKQIQRNGTAYLDLNASGYLFYKGVLTIDGAAAGLTLSVGQHPSGAGGTTAIAGQQGAAGNFNGGHLTATPGAKTGSGTDGTGFLNDAAGNNRFRWNSTGIGFHTTTPIAQASDVGLLTDSTTGSADSTVQDVTGSHNQGILNNNFADLIAKINALRNVVHNVGLTA